MPILENFENMTMFIPVFALNKGLTLYQEVDFATHFSGTSLDRPLYQDPLKMSPFWLPIKTYYGIYAKGLFYKMLIENSETQGS